MSQDILNQESMKIISENDFRYEYLNEIFDTYNQSNFSIKPIGRTKPYYIIPYQLVLTEYETDNFGIYYSNNCDIPNTNIVSSLYFRRVLYDTCKLTPQEYYDLMILHINDTDDRPRCSVCGSMVNFDNQFSKAYTRSEDHNYFCSKECQNNSGVDGGLINWVAKSKANRTKFLNLGDINDQCVFYIATCNNKFKFGVSQNIEVRSEYMRYSNYKELFYGTRLQVADLELLVKYNLGTNHEYIEFNSLMYKFRSAFRTSLQILLSGNYSLNSPDDIL